MSNRPQTLAEWEQVALECRAHHGDDWCEDFGHDDMLALVEVANAELAALRAENERLRTLLMHRCTVKQIDPQCEDCLAIDAALAAESGEGRG